MTLDNFDRSSNQHPISEKYFRTIFEQSPLGIALINPLSGKFYEINSRYAEIADRTCEDLLQQDWMSITHPDDVEKVQDNIVTLKSGKISCFSMDKRVIHSDNSFIWVNLTVAPLQSEDNTSFKYFFILKDISLYKHTQSKLKQQDERLKAVVNGILDAMVQIDNQDIICDWNIQAENMFGWQKTDIIGKTLHETIIPERYRQQHIQGIKRFLSSGESKILNSRIETYAQHYNGHEFPIELSIVPLKMNGVYEFHAFMRNITERKRSEQKLVEREQRYHLLINSSPYCIHEIGLNGYFLSINDAGLKMLELENEEQVLSVSCFKLVGVQDKGRINDLFKKALNGTPSHFEFRGGNNNLSYFKSCFIPIKDKDNNVVKIMGLTEDITSQKESEILAWKHANYDLLTGLPNRCMFYEYLTQEIKKAARSSSFLALLVIDIDRFKDVNDTLGHSAGDILLQDTAKRLKSCVRDMDMVARLGGDEFALILSNIEEPGNIERIVTSILQKMSEPFQLESQPIYGSASIGITLYPADATDMETLLKNADQAMYAAKHNGRNRYNYFTPFMQKAAQVRMQIANDLRGALNNNEFQLYYQPIVDLRTDLICKAEALIRWQHPKHGLISPAAFIPIAEENRMIIEIGDWVFHHASSQAKKWREHYHPEFQISINKSPVQFNSEHRAHASWLNHLKNLNLPGQGIVVEITEGLLLDISSNVTQQLLNFRDAGIQVSLDDFGTGYSSLSYLKKFDIDYIKIDQSFVRNLEDDSDDLILCEAIIVMAHKLGIKVIAEGIETEEQRNLLTAIDCDYGQGYLFSRPVEAKKLEILLKNNAA